MPVIVPDVLGQDTVEVPLAEDQHVVQALAAQRAHEPLRVRVRPRRPDRRPDHPRAIPGEDAVECRGELAVPVTDQGPQFNIPTLVAGYTIGAFLFPVTGYLYAVISGTTNFGTSTRFFAQSTLFGLTFLATFFFFIQAFAGNDGNLYLSTNASQNLIGSLRHWRRQYTVLILGSCAAVVSLFFSSLSTDFFIMANLSAVTIPSASTIMVMDRFVLPWLTRKVRPTDKVTPWHRTGQANCSAIVALISATAVGGVTRGLIPGLPSFGKAITGCPALQAWVTGAVIYLVLGTLAARRANYKSLLGYPVEETEQAAEGQAALQVG
jgi:hypothetical protein